MTKLSGLKRAAIHKRLLTHAYFEQAQSRLDEQADFVRRVYLKTFGKALPLIERVPSDWFYKGRDFSVSFAGDVVRLYPGLGLNYNVPDLFQTVGAKRLPEFWILPYQTKNGVNCIFEEDDPLVHEHVAHQIKANALLEKIRDASRASTVALGAFRTVKELLDNWPEIATVASDLLGPVPRANLPAIPRDSLNRTLNLPA